MPRRYGLVAVVLAVGTVAAVLPSPARTAEPRVYTEGVHGRAELKYRNGLPVLRVAGTPEEIGEQVAALTAEPMKRLLEYPRQSFRKLAGEAAWPRLIVLSNSMLPQFPGDYRRELDAIVGHSGVDHDLAVAGNTLPDIMKIGGCSTLIVQPDRSARGGPLFGRNLDYPTLGYLQKYSLVIIYRPTGKHALASVGFPGLVGCISGINDAGLAVASLVVETTKDGSPRFDPKGVPYTLGFRRLLEECTTVDEAEKLLRSMRRTTMNNLAVCDRQGGAVFEITPKNVVVRRAEGGLCACTNHFRTPELTTCSVDELAACTNCRRYACLVGKAGVDPGKAAVNPQPKFDLPEIARRLHAANQGDYTLQTMIFEPVALKLHLAIGITPSSALPLKELDLAPLLASDGGAAR